MEKSTRQQIPSIFVSKNNYPNIAVGFLSTTKDQFHDNPQFWANRNYQIPLISGLRKDLLHTPFVANVKERANKQLELAQEFALAKRAVNAEITYISRNTQSLKSQGEAIPFGPSAKLSRVTPIENTPVDHRLEKAYYDIDASATTSLHELYKKGVQEHILSKLLSVGGLGRGQGRKLVPTRWSITAVDDTLCKSLKDKIVTEDTLPYQAFMGDYLGNYFLVLIYDGPFMFHFIEVMPNKVVKEDCESALGRTEYAKETAGGYYAAKEGVLSYLASIKKQATVVCIRFITDEYYQGLGVWVVRESVKKTMATQSILFSDKELLSTYAKKFSQKKYGVNLQPFIDGSLVLKTLKSQKRLFEFS